MVEMDELVEHQGVFDELDLEVDEMPITITEIMVQLLVVLEQMGELLHDDEGVKEHEGVELEE
jgi:hypothetical protein